MKALFIAGTDTEIGKTVVTSALLRALRRRGVIANGMKPVAAGTDPDSPYNSDALMLLENSSEELTYTTVNPVLYPDPTSPNIAAARANSTLVMDDIVAAFQRCGRSADVVLVEGIGGWRVPLSDHLQTVDLVRALELDAVLVAGIRLGAINHTLLSAECMLADGVEIRGWIANIVDPTYAFATDTIATISDQIGVPLLATIAWRQPFDVDKIADDLAAVPHILNLVPDDRTS